MCAGAGRPGGPWPARRLSRSDCAHAHRVGSVSGMTAVPAVVPQWSASDHPRDRIVAAACELFNRSGIRGVGVDAIMAEAGVARGTFYRYFPSKDLLILAFLERADAEWRSWFTTSVLAAGATAAEQLVGVFRVLPAWFASPTFRGSPIINVAAELGADQQQVADLARTHERHVRAFLHEVASRLDSGDPDVLAARVHLLLTGVIVSAQLESNVAVRAVFAAHAEVMARVLLPQ